MVAPGGLSWPALAAVVAASGGALTLAGYLGGGTGAGVVGLWLASIGLAGVRFGADSRDQADWRSEPR